MDNSNAFVEPDSATEHGRKWCILLFVAIILQFLFLSIYCYRYHFSSAMFESDAASEVLLAENIYENGGHVFSKDWCYSTEIRVLHNQLVMVPLFSFTNNYNLVYTAGFMIWTALILLSVYFCIRSYSGTIRQSLLATLFFLIPYGAYRRYSPFSMHFFNGYYSFFLFNTFLFLGLLQQYKKSERNGRTYGILTVLSVLSFGLGCCGVRYALLVFGPLLCVELIQFLWEAKDKFSLSSVRTRCYLIPLIICFGIGYITYSKHILVTFGGTRNYASTLKFAFFSQALSQFQQVISGFLEGLGFSWDGGKAFSILGIVNLIFLVFTGLSVFLFTRLIRKCKNLNLNLRNYVLFAGAQVTVNVVALTFFGVDDYGAIVRYVWIGCICCLPLLALVEQEKLRRIICLGGDTVMFAGGSSALGFVPSVGKIGPVIWRKCI